ncbi:MULTISPECIES: Fe2+-dependent dioxygenase [Pseudoalteromonas]|uniref:Fe2+-dependent dioxygenase n=1 Tax=Pseudoalteromonas haloplanktis TaxID=228 RepID=A0ABU1BCZ7_PSEHA|nr:MULTISPECIES: Fe2+-dependent dioxygenase [Pseudoalteromonas]MCF6144137.1 PKHD-type hydroxylase [Pseudoalteromonas mariniglutinosa NCIMB 1770]MDQ9091824.1 Fe2+-dependent dioxygenase [Pseudoalteromonas haloplanktis]TMN68214.1 Fe2+-dependent dioxygenase [Pseudoalteromonas sp. S1727]BDF96532.1 PKHD-type hydroxylase PiuC [Pseudoalteromonas sp. KAN5]
MLLKIPDLLSADEVAYCRKVLLAAQWTDGSVTAGYQSTKTKNNLQLPEQSVEAKELGDIVMGALARSNLFMSGALPAKIFPPLFNCYQGGQSFGIHVDNAIRQVPGTPVKIRTDLSMTLFFSDPEDYDGGELIIEDTYGSHSVKLPAGSMVLYPSSSLHKVTPVTRGRRLASFFWLQSMVNSDERRTLLFELDSSIQSLREKVSDSPEIVRLTGVYHNLLRQWAQT